MISESFIFKNTNEYTLLHQTINDLEIIINRYIRRHQMPNTKQPVPFGAILGTEVELKAKYLGLPASGYKFKLFIDGKCIQDDIISQSGEFAGLLLEKKDALYRIKITD